MGAIGHTHPGGGEEEVKGLPVVEFCGREMSRLICGGNPLSGFSHTSSELDREMVEYYTMPAIQHLLERCWHHGINTYQSRGDRHQMRAYLEHRLSGGRMQWIAQTASEFRDIPANVAEIAQYEPAAIYNHGTHTDNCWHTGKIDDVREVIEAIHAQGLPAGVGTHIPEVVVYVEEQGWEVDFYMCCFYNLARGYKSAPAVDQDAYARDRFSAEDPPLMTDVIRNTSRPCIAFKLMAAGRNCASPEDTREAIRFALENIKPTDLINVGMFPKHRDQVAENAAMVREILES